MEIKAKRHEEQQRELEEEEENSVCTHFSYNHLYFPDKLLIFPYFLSLCSNIFFYRFSVWFFLSLWILSIPLLIMSNAV